MDIVFDTLNLGVYNAVACAGHARYVDTQPGISRIGFFACAGLAHVYAQPTRQVHIPVPRFEA